MEIDRSLNGNVPPKQNDLYVEEMCCSYMKFRYPPPSGRFHKAMIPAGLSPGAPFIVVLKPGINSAFQHTRYLKCKVPLVELHDPSCYDRCEVGGGKNEIIIYHSVGDIDPNNPTSTSSIIAIQGLRIIKEHPINALKYCLPIPLASIIYFSFYDHGGGCCEELEGMEWAEVIDEAAIAGFPSIDAVRWIRDDGDGECNGTLCCCFRGQHDSSQNCEQNPIN